MKFGTTMMDPENIIFENGLDVIDYATAGLIPPKKTKFDLLMQSIENYDPEKSPIVIEMENINDPQQLVAYARRAYENRCKTMMTVGIIAGVATVVAVGAIISEHNKNKDN